MLLTIFLTIVFCAAITLMLISAVAFVQNKKFFSSAPKEAQAVTLDREEELFLGARKIGWTLMIFSFLMILGVGVILKLLVIFPGASALAAWICTLFMK